MTALPHMDITIDPSTGEILDSLAEVGKGIATETDLILPPLTVPEWTEAYTKVAALAEASQWWLGALYASMPDDTCYQVLDEHSREHLEKCSWVYRSVPPTNRRSDLSWSHHKCIAKYSPIDEQSDLLELASSRELSVTEFTAYLKAYDNQLKGQDAPPETDKVKSDPRAVLSLCERKEGSTWTLNDTTAVRFWLGL